MRGEKQGTRSEWEKDASRIKGREKVEGGKEGSLHGDVRMINGRLSEKVERGNHSDGGRVMARCREKNMTDRKREREKVMMAWRHEKDTP